jgi:hypothetical protein
MRKLHHSFSEHPSTGSTKHGTTRSTSALPPFFGSAQTREHSPVRDCRMQSTHPTCATQQNNASNTRMFRVLLCVCLAAGLMSPKSSFFFDRVSGVKSGNCSVPGGVYWDSLSLEKPLDSEFSPDFHDGKTTSMHSPALRDAGGIVSAVLCVSRHGFCSRVSRVDESKSSFIFFSTLVVAGGKKSEQTSVELCKDGRSSQRVARPSLRTPAC